MSVRSAAPSTPNAYIIQAFQSAGKRTSEVVNLNIGKEPVRTQPRDPTQALLDLRLPPEILNLFSPSIEKLGLILGEDKAQYKYGPERQYTVVKNNRGQQRELLYIHSEILNNEANNDAISSLVYAFKRGSILNIFSDLSGDPLPYLRTIMEGLWLDVWQVKGSVMPVKCVEEGLSSKNPEGQQSWVMEQLKLNDLITLQVGEQVFISYSHEDSTWLYQLKKFLTPLVREEGIKIWADTEIKPGTKWREEINKALDSAKVAVLLVTQNFLASDFIAKHELPPLLDAAKEKGLTILWIAVSSSTYKHTELKNYSSVNDPDRPLDDLIPSRRNKEWVQISEKIMQAANIQ